MNEYIIFIDKITTKGWLHQPRLNHRLTNLGYFLIEGLTVSRIAIT